MASERRYSEDDVAKILDRATAVETDRQGRTGDAEAHGLTLRELQEIGREVGISPDVISRAAADLDRPTQEPAPRRRFLGSTIGVGRTITLPRRLTDGEWNRLVVDLRDTFDARGRIREDGDFKQWTNGNLQALVEPTAEGARLRLRTVKGSAYPSLGWGAALLAGAPVVWLSTMIGGATTDLSVPFVLGAIGAALFGGAKVTLPVWADTRERQMGAIIERLTHAVTAADAARQRERGEESTGDETS
jgi:hypothetical protein